MTTPAHISGRPANGAHNGDLDRHAVARAYAHWAPVYDAICGPILASGRRAAAHAASRIGGRILEVGVGTGLLFDDYTRDAEITGIDLSERMIAQAHKRLHSGKYPHVKNLLIMDAHRLAFADASFDCVVIPFVITLVTHPEGVLSECARVVKPGGEIVLVSHLYSESGVLAAIERWTARPTSVLGLRPNFPFRRIADWVHRNGDIAALERRKVRPFGAYTLVRMQRATSRADPATIVTTR